MSRTLISQWRAQFCSTATKGMKITESRQWVYLKACRALRVDPCKQVLAGLVTDTLVVIDFPLTFNALHAVCIALQVCILTISGTSNYFQITCTSNYFPITCTSNYFPNYTYLHYFPITFPNYMYLQLLSNYVYLQCNRPCI